MKRFADIENIFHDAIRLPTGPNHFPAHGETQDRGSFRVPFRRSFRASFRHILARALGDQLGDDNAHSDLAERVDVAQAAALRTTAARRAARARPGRHSAAADRLCRRVSQSHTGTVRPMPANAINQ